MENQKLRSQIEQLFELPVMKMSWVHYFALLNESGKITERSLMNLMVILVTRLEELESTNK